MKFLPPKFEFKFKSDFPMQSNHTLFLYKQAIKPETIQKIDNPYENLTRIMPKKDKIVIKSILKKPKVYKYI